MKHNIVYTVTHNGQLAFASESKTDAYNYMIHILYSSVENVVNEWGLENATEKDLYAATFRATLDHNIKLHQLDLSQYAIGESIILEDNTEFSYDDIIMILENSYFLQCKKIYIVIRNDQLAFASQSKTTADNYITHIICSETEDVLEEWGIENATAKDLYAAAFQAGINGDSISSYQLDLSQYTIDEPIILENNTVLNCKDIIKALQEQCLTDF